MCRFCDELKPTEHAQLLTPYLAHYIQQLAAMSGEFPEDVVVMVTEALQLVIQVLLLSLESTVYALCHSFKT